MTFDEIRIAMGELDGWKDVHLAANRFQWWGYRNSEEDAKVRGREYQCVPDYLTDRDAMYVVFMSLNDLEKLSCIAHLCCLPIRWERLDMDQALLVASASTMQWAEAILKTKDEWKVI